jgi:hypothetical protein
MFSAEIPDNPEIIFEGNKVFFKVSRDGIIVKERVPSHVMKMDKDRAEVYIDEIVKKAKKQLEAACQFEAMKKAAEEQNAQLSHDWATKNQVQNAQATMFILLVTILKLPWLLIKNIFWGKRADKKL